MAGQIAPEIAMLIHKSITTELTLSLPAGRHSLLLQGESK